MNLPVNTAQNQAIGCGDRNHKASITRQRKAASATSPVQQAQAIASVVRKRLADGQAVPDLDRYRLDDATWAELLDILGANELSAIADVCVGDDLDGGEDEPSADDITKAFEYDVPFTPEPPAPSHTLSWRDHEPPIVHSLKWHDGDGIEHLHVVRTDDLDEALRHILKVKLCIKAAQLKAQQKTSEPAQAPVTDSRPDWCPIHSIQMKERSNVKGKWFSHALDGGGFCKGK
jgi:hypothetical protein